MELRHLKYFDSIVRNQQISKAAEELFISQPALSTQLKTLEKQLNCKLIERNAREFSLTEPGEILWKHTNSILKQIKIAKEEIRDWKNLSSGEIYIGTLPTPLTSWLPTVLASFKKDHPNISVHIKEMNTMEIQDAIINYDIHMGITSHTKTIEKEPFMSEMIIQDKLLLVTSNKFKFKNESSISLTELIDKPFILYESGFHLREIILNATREEGFEPSVSYQSGKIETILSFVSAGLGVAIIPETAIKFGSKRDVKVLKINNSNLTRGLCIIKNKKRYISPAMKAFQLAVFDFFVPYSI